MHIDKRSSNKIFLTDHEIEFQAYFTKSNNQ